MQAINFKTLPINFLKKPWLFSVRELSKQKFKTMWAINIESSIYPTPKNGVPTNQDKNHELLSFVDPLANFYLSNPIFSNSLWNMGNHNMSLQNLIIINFP